MVNTVRTRDERDKPDVVDASIGVDNSFDGQLARAAAGELVPCEVHRAPDGSIIGVETITAALAFEHLIAKGDRLDTPRRVMVLGLFDFIVRTAIEGDEQMWTKLRKMSEQLSTGTDRRADVIATIERGIFVFHDPRVASDAADPRTAKTLRALKLVVAPYSGWAPERAIGVYKVLTSLSYIDGRFAKLTPASIYHLLAAAKGTSRSPGAIRIAARLSTKVGAFDDGRATADAAGEVEANDDGSATPEDVIHRAEVAFRKALKANTKMQASKKI